jgi:hypothetical protein
MRLIAAFGAALAATAAIPALAADLDCQLGIMAGSVFGRSQHVPDGSAPLSDRRRCRRIRMASSTPHSIGSLRCVPSPGTTWVRA